MLIETTKRKHEIENMIVFIVLHFYMHLQPHKSNSILDDWLIQAIKIHRDYVTRSQQNK